MQKITTNNQKKKKKVSATRVWELLDLYLNDHRILDSVGSPCWDSNPSRVAPLENLLSFFSRVVL